MQLPIQSPLFLSPSVVKRITFTFFYIFYTLLFFSWCLVAKSWEACEEKDCPCTHKSIVLFAIKKLEFDSQQGRIYLNNKEKIALKKLVASTHSIVESTALPDFDHDSPYQLNIRIPYHTITQNLYNDHFYSTTTHQGLKLSEALILGGFNLSLLQLNDTPPENALSQSIRYYSRAVEEERTGSNKTALYLGMASHYFSDIFQPHHSSNYPWGPLDKSHVEFEVGVDQHFNELITLPKVLETKVDYNWAQNSVTLFHLIKELINFYSPIAANYLLDIVEPISEENKRRAEIALPYSLEAAAYFLTNREVFPSKWKLPAQDMLMKNMQALTLIYYRFIKEVANYKRPTENYQDYPLDEIELEIQTSSQSDNIAYDDGHFFLELKEHLEYPDLDASYTASSRVIKLELEKRNFYRRWSFFKKATSSFFLLIPVDQIPYSPKIYSICLKTIDLQAKWKITSLKIYAYGQLVFSNHNDTHNLLPKDLLIDKSHCWNVPTGLRYFIR